MQTYRAVITGATFASGKSMLGLFNGVGSGRILRIMRAWQLNNQVTGVTGVITTMGFRKTSAQSGGTTAPVVKHDSASENIPAQVLSATGATVTNTGDPAIMRWMWSNDEPAASSLSNDETETIPELAKFFDATGDANIEPIVCREGQGVSVHHEGTSAVGVCDVIIEFTMAAS